MGNLLQSSFHTECPVVKSVLSSRMSCRQECSVVKSVLSSRVFRKRSDNTLYTRRAHFIDDTVYIVYKEYKENHQNWLKNKPSHKTSFLAPWGFLLCKNF